LTTALAYRFDGFGEFLRHGRGLVSKVCPRSPFPYTDSITKHGITSQEPIMAMLTIFLSDEEMRRLEELSKREGLTVEQMVRLGINDFIDQPDESVRTAARRVIEKNAELYRRLS
jgi:hypothetical protein